MKVDQKIDDENPEDKGRSCHGSQWTSVKYWLLKMWGQGLCERGWGIQLEGRQVWQWVL